MLRLFLALFVLMAAACSAPPGTMPSAVSELTAVVKAQPSATPRFGIPTSALPLIQADDESLEDFLARVAATAFIGDKPEGLVASSVLNSRFALYRGVSTRATDIRRCWHWRGGILHPCSGQNPGAEWRRLNSVVPKPHVYFAPSSPIGERADRALVVFDIYHGRPGNDPVDGYHVGLGRQQGRWRVESVRPVY